VTLDLKCLGECSLKCQLQVQLVGHLTNQNRLPHRCKKKLSDMTQQIPDTRQRKEGSQDLKRGQKHTKELTSRPQNLKSKWRAIKYGSSLTLQLPRLILSYLHMSPALAQLEAQPYASVTTPTFQMVDKSKKKARHCTQAFQ